ncbi:EVE domain-containing protein [Capsulimonas corticalis]|uniref:EVE domain-containing protein n=2 Tax=Capsulimonas corticalis TaxID=2219043 RepID=A0A402CWM9_9BACT|nr:EVE domain-containing protein [Capsulimonas corticalis]
MAASEYNIGMANYWLVKSEPSCFSIDELAQVESTHWDGVRNYQARNFMRDGMKLGDKVLYYHSNCDPPGVVGVAEVSREAYPDFTAWDPTNDHFDPKSTPDNPIWMMMDIKFVAKFPREVSLPELKQAEGLEGLVVIQKGSRLSVQPVSEAHFALICQMGGL